MRKGRVFFKGSFAGIIYEDDEGIHFQYDKDYLDNEESESISLTLPKTEEVYSSKTMLPFFDGLIPEGWLLSIAEKNWKIDARDRMGLLLVFCEDCIGAVSIFSDQNDE